MRHACVRGFTESGQSRPGARNVAVLSELIKESILTFQRSRSTKILGSFPIRRVSLEFLLALIAAALMVFVSRYVQSVPDPAFKQDLQAGHVSALAAMQIPFYFFVALGTAAILLSVRIHRFKDALLAFGPAILAGAATGYVAGSVNIALAGTNWPLFGNVGDSGVILTWVNDLLAGRSLPSIYPPGYLWLISGISETLGAPVQFAAKVAQIGFLALGGPVAYLVWRLSVGPYMALLLGVVAMLPLIDPYKPYPSLALVVLMALVARCVQDLRQAPGTGRRWALVRGGALGAAVGITALVYSGWFAWTAAGIIAVLAINFPWRKPKEQVRLALWYAGSTGLWTLIVGGVHLVPMVYGIIVNKGIADNYFYADTYVDPGFFVMWLGDSVSPVVWPPPGELGGVGVFMLLLCVALAMAIAMAWRKPMVQSAVFILASALAARYLIAPLMVSHNTVNLWPRTTSVAVFSLLLLATVAARELWKILKGQAREKMSRISVSVGIFLGIALLLSTSVSSISAKYFPTDGTSVARFAQIAQHMENVDVSCFPLILLERCKPTE